MWQSTRRIRRGVAYALCLAALGACGGGGGGGGDGGGEEPPALDLLSGYYGYSGFLAYRNPVVKHETRWGQLVSPGDGTFRCNYLFNDDTNVLSTSVDHTYTIAAGRALTFLTNGYPYATGRVSATGQHAALTWLEPGGIPGSLLALRRRADLPGADSDYTDADLAHVYNGCGLEYIPGSDLVRGTVGRYTFNGTGGWSGTYTVNLEGDVYGSQVFGPGAYSVNSAGGTTFIYESGFDLTGNLNENGDLLAVAGGISDGDALYQVVFVRAGTGLGNASLSGTYQLAGLYYDFRAGVQDWVAVGGTLTADGAGGYTATLRNNQATSISAPYTQTGTYAVSSSGELTLTRSSGEAFGGGLARDGTFAVFGGGTTDLSMPSLFFLVR